MKFKDVILMSSALSGMLHISTAHAQTATSSVAVEEVQTDGIDDIVVTARKKAENLQSTPVAVTAVTGHVRQGGVILAVAVAHRQAALVVMCRG